jgi:hypothetical protein
VMLAIAFRNGAVGIEDPRIPADGTNPGRLLPMELDILGGGRFWVEREVSQIRSLLSRTVSSKSHL